MGTIPNLKKVQKRVCEVTGIGRTTVNDLIRKERSMGEGNAFDSPTKKRKEEQTSH